MPVEIIGDVQSPGTPTKGVGGGDIASAATIALTKYLHRVTGAAAVSLITLPYDGFEGTLALLPTGAFTLATGGAQAGLNFPVGLASTAVVGKVLFVTFHKGQALWYPSY
jgi:hypothetical protein